MTKISTGLNAVKALQRFSAVRPIDSKMWMLLFMLLCFINLTAANKQVASEADVFVKIQCPAEGYVGQPIPYEIFLYSDSENIADIKVIRQPSFSAFQAIEGEGDGSRAQKVTVKGKKYWRWNVGRTFLLTATAGNFDVKGGEYVVFLPKEVIVNDFFFGSMRSVEYDRIPISAPDVKIKIRDLPGRYKGSDLPIGDFSVVAWLPPGDISAGNDAIAIIKISGEGMLRNREIPDISGIFEGVARLKNVERADNIVQKDGRLHSEIVLECHFVPNDDKGEIGAFSFSFFDIKSGKMKTVTTEPQPWNNADEYTPVDKSKLKIMGI